GLVVLRRLQGSASAVTLLSSVPFESFVPTFFFESGASRNPGDKPEFVLNVVRWKTNNYVGHQRFPPDKYRNQFYVPDSRNLRESLRLPMNPPPGLQTSTSRFAFPALFLSCLEPTYNENVVRDRERLISKVHSSELT